MAELLFDTQQEADAFAALVKKNNSTGFDTQDEANRFAAMVSKAKSQQPKKPAGELGDAWAPYKAGEGVMAGIGGTVANIIPSAYKSIVDPMAVAPVKNVYKLGEKATEIPDVLGGEFQATGVISDQAKKLKVEIDKVKAEPDSVLKEKKLELMNAAGKGMWEATKGIAATSIMSPVAQTKMQLGELKDAIMTIPAIGQYYKQRYGKDLLKTLQEDPVGVVIDVSAILDVAGSAAKGVEAGAKGVRGIAEAELGAGATKVGTVEKVASTTGDVLKTAAKYTSPFTPLSKAVAGVKIGTTVAKAEQQFAEMQGMVTTAKKLDTLAGTNIEGSLPGSVIQKGPAQTIIENVSQTLAPGSATAQRMTTTLDELGSAVEKYQAKLGVSASTEETRMIIDNGYREVRSIAHKAVEDGLEKNSITELLSEKDRTPEGIIEKYDDRIKMDVENRTEWQKSKQEVQSSYEDLRVSAEELQHKAQAFKFVDVKPKIQKALNTISDKIVKGTATIKDIKDIYKHLDGLISSQKDPMLQAMAFNMQSKIENYMYKFVSPSERIAIEITQSQAFRAMYNSSARAKIEALTSRNIPASAQEGLAKDIASDEQNRKVIVSTALRQWANDEKTGFIKIIKNDATGTITRRELDATRLKELNEKIKDTAMDKVLSKEDHEFLQSLQIIGENSKQLARPYGKVASAIEKVARYLGGGISTIEVARMLLSKGDVAINAFMTACITWMGIRGTIGLLGTPAFKDLLTTGGFKSAEDLLKARGFMRGVGEASITQKKEFAKTPGGYMDVKDTIGPAIDTTRER